MKDFWNFDGGYTRIAGKIFDTLLLGCLWLICCVPVVTAGASTSALYYAFVKSVKQDRGYAVREFFHGFRINWKAATIGWLVSLLIGAIAVWNLKIVNQMETSDFTAFLLVLNIVVLVFLTVMSIYFYPAVSRFENSFGGYLKLSVYMAIRHVGTTLLCLIILAMGGIFVWRIRMLIWVIPGPVCFLVSEFMEKVLLLYTPENDRPL